MNHNEPISRLINTLTEIIGEKHGLKIKADLKDRKEVFSNTNGSGINEKRNETETRNED
jgi:hypothetical protein